MHRPARVAILLAANALVLAALLELTLRVQEPFLHLMSWGTYRSPNHHYAVIDHPIWDHQLRPGLVDFELEVRPPVLAQGFRYRLDTNSWGCRYAEVQVPRPARHYRVIVLGDSFTEGYREEETVSAQLEQALDAQGQGVDFEVMNCGVSSYSMLPILLRLRDQLLAADPDAVIVNIDLTDLHDDWRRSLDLRSDASGRPLAVGREGAGRSRLRDFLETHSYVARAGAAYGRLASKTLRHFLRGKRRSASDAAGDLYTQEEQDRLHSYEPGAEADFEAAFGFFAVQLDRVVGLCRESGIACAFSTYPHREQLPVGGQPPRLHREFARRIGARLAEQGVPFFDAYDDIAAAYARDPTLYFTGDMHFRPSGQRAWGRAFAAAFAPWVMENARAAR